MSFHVLPRRLPRSQLRLTGRPRTTAPPHRGTSHIQVHRRGAPTGEKNVTVQTRSFVRDAPEKFMRDTPGLHSTPTTLQ